MSVGWLRRLARRLHGVFSRQRDQAIREELQLHLDLLTAEYRAQGLSERDARAQARREFGNPASLRERTRLVTTYLWLEVVWQDTRHALVGLRRHPGFAAAGLATLALAIGATTTVFSLVYGVLLRPLPFVDPGTLVRLWEEQPGGHTIAGQRWLSQWTYHAWIGHQRTLAELGGYTTWSTVVKVNDDAFPVGGASLTPSLVDMLGARTVVGRWFTTADTASSAVPVIVLSHRLWQDRFGGRPDIVGRAVLVNDEPVTVVGVAVPEVRFPSDRADCWRPYAVPTPAAEPRRTLGFNAVGRLAPDVTPAQVEAEGTAAARSVNRPMSADVVFGKGGPVVIHARPMAEDTVAAARPPLLALAVAVALVLLVACANVANLLLSRGLARQREFAIRMAVGASRARLVSQTLTETLVLATGAGVLGTAMAALLVRALPAFAPQRLPRVDDVRLDAHGLLAAAVATLTAACLSGLLPAIRSTATDAIGSIRGGDGGGAEGFRTRGASRLRDGLLVLESALAVVLLVGALLVGHSLVRLMKVDPGYRPESVVAASVSLPRGSRPERAAAFVDALRARLGVRPGVSAIGAANTMPMVPRTALESFPIAPEPGADEVVARSVTYVVTPGYAEAIGLRLEAGRFFTAGDQRPGVRALIVNDEFVRRYLRGPVVGRQFARLHEGEGPVPTEIVGVVGNVLKDGYDQAAEPEIYFVQGGSAQTLGVSFAVAVRTDHDPTAVISSVRETAASIDRGAVVERVDRLADQVSASMAQPRFATMVLGLLAALGISLSSVGLFAVLSYAVTQRRREMGIRAALGASRMRLLSLVLRQGLLVTALGLALGLVAAAGLTRLLQGLLFGITPLDPLSFALAPLLLLPAALAAVLIPAIRASATAPAIVLRGE